ncbi:LytTR family DNA-binding domain-containing protein [Clostridium malenominatum]|uniref:LytTR family DNA-binding domain-containing protein n=1 Tax=Clostridium malenominatum TaxID=1539 RepID=A0ABP3UEH7_9CLOT
MIVVKLEEHLSQKDIDVLIRYSKMNQTVKRLITLIKSIDSSVKCNSDGIETWVNASDIYYIESVDKRTFVYGEKFVCQTDLRLYQLIEELSSVGFVQISKSCILNLNYLESIRTLMNSRMEATLTNGERVTVTRKYIPKIKSSLLER